MGSAERKQTSSTNSHLGECKKKTNPKPAQVLSIRKWDLVILVATQELKV